MWHPARVTTAATGESVSVPEAKAQLRLVDASRDAEVAAMIAAARAWVEAYCGIFITQQGVTAECDGFADFRRLVVAPVIDIASISYVDGAGATQPVDGSVYQLRKDGLSPCIELKAGKSWPSVQVGSRITVVMVAGHETVPADLKQAVLLKTSGLFAMARDDVFKRSEQVEGVGETVWSGGADMAGVMDRAVTSLLEHYRNWGALA